MYLSGSHLQLRKASQRSNPRRILLWLILIATGLIILNLRQRGVVQPLLVPTPTATRNALSFAQEAEAQFAAGRLKEAIKAYKSATAIEPRNIDYWVALARFQIYDQQFEAALQSARTALVIASDNVKAVAIHAWALDWNREGVSGCRCTTIEEAEAEALRALAIDSNYAPAHAYYSEILNDSMKWNHGSREARAALELDPYSLDARRAMGYANESIGNYLGAIEYYQKALEINPNLVMLHIAIGKNYRAAGQPDKAITAFEQAIRIDPQNTEPYLAISRTYYQIDRLGPAEQYLRQALKLEPANADIHGRLGLILFKRKNYEDAEVELRLAVEGGKLLDKDGQPLLGNNGQPIVLQPVELDSISREYYYTLGNLLAAYGRCQPDEAPALLSRVLAMFPEEPTIKASYEESMAICRNFLAGTAVPSPTVSAPSPSPTK